MKTPRISASSYSNTAPLIWSFLYGSQHGQVELILDNAPSRSAELLAQDRVGAALVPVIAYQLLPDVRLVPDVCVGAKEKVRSVALITRGMDLEDVRSVSLDTSSKTSVVLTKIIFREFLEREPEWRNAAPNIDAMLDESDAALLIGDPSLKIADCGLRIADLASATSQSSDSRSIGSATDDHSGESAIRDPQSAIRKFDLAELWKRYTSLGFVFAMWMTKLDKITIDLAAARDEGLDHLDEIAANYSELGLSLDAMREYLSENISYSIDDSMRAGMELYFRLAGKCGLIDGVKPTAYLK
ncbi:MAG TPA: menaquinone biosynthesis protein [Pyrinomonadaceae bacterium]|nr:menaquinone biosynthesis protein [Pyrinomonadaceae bacterium]